MDDLLEVRGHVARIGRTSFALRHEIFRVSPGPETILARGREERVYAHREPGGKLHPHPLTEDMRETLARYAGNEE
jgi:acyl-CoA thioesterase FadM